MKLLRQHSTALLAALMLLYGAASLAHFAHNAISLRAYPALPAWITRLGVWLAWCGLTVIGAVGYWRYS